MDKEIIGNEVIGIPCQSLTPGETRLVVGLADGEPPLSISSALGVSVPELRHVENAALNKLGGKSRAHLITRAFVLGVLRPRAITALLGLILVAALLAFLYRWHVSVEQAKSWETWAGQTAGPAMQDPRYNGRSLRR